MMIYHFFYFMLKMQQIRGIGLFHSDIYWIMLDIGYLYQIYEAFS